MHKSTSEWVSATLRLCRVLSAFLECDEPTHYDVPKCCDRQRSSSGGCLNVWVRRSANSVGQNRSQGPTAEWMQRVDFGPQVGLHLWEALQSCEPRILCTAMPPNSSITPQETIPQAS